MSNPPPPQDHGSDPYAQPPAGAPQSPNVYGSPEQPWPSPSYSPPAQQAWQPDANPYAYGAHGPAAPPPKPKRTGLVVGLGVVGLLVVGGIGAALSWLGGDDTDAGATDGPTSVSTVPTQRPTAVEPTTEEAELEVVPDDTYYSFADLRDAYVAAGGDCETPVEPPKPGITSLYQAECPDGSILALFATEADMLDQSNLLLAVMAESDAIDGVLILSDTWTINPGRSVDVDQITSVMGGEVVTEEDYARIVAEESEAPDEEESQTPAEEPTESDLSISQQNAIGTARNYLDYTGFSREGLIDQLEYEGYSNDDATFAVDHLDVDWNEQAAIVAQNYLDYTSFSRQSLLDQLLYEGFTQEQAEYGLEAVGY